MKHVLIIVTKVFGSPLLSPAAAGVPGCGAAAEDGTPQTWAGETESAPLTHTLSGRTEERQWPNQGAAPAPYAELAVSAPALSDNPAVSQLPTLALARARALRGRDVGRCFADGGFGLPAATVGRVVGCGSGLVLGWRRGRDGQRAGKRRRPLPSLLPRRLRPPLLPRRLRSV